MRERGWYVTGRWKGQEDACRYWNGVRWSRAYLRSEVPPDTVPVVFESRTDLDVNIVEPMDALPAALAAEMAREDAVTPLCGCTDGECRSEGKRCRLQTALAMPPSAAGMLRQAAEVLEQRAREYDKPGGERSMAATVVAFNAITGAKLSESQGWLFMELLKAVRDYGTPAGHKDSQVDRINYAALGAEARRAGR